ncbi:unnamed protein product [Rangifer tarandus platyrhynchus]|uniref:Uncharacterized protein n=1 Tax=Rangifer tarandus platyrhynchus TaxID=3082113 RepID=A0ABN8Y6A9_RANTA|nr:unnamed protein product [Rangifer tarandus platyrhynchus]
MNKTLQSCTGRVDWICQFSCGYEVLGGLTISGGVLFTGITQNQADGVTTISNMVSFQWQRAREFLNFLTLAVKYSGQEKTHGLPFTAHWPELVTWLQCNPRGSGSEKLPVTGSKEMEIFGQEHRCSAHTVTCSASQPGL